MFCFLCMFLRFSVVCVQTMEIKIKKTQKQQNIKRIMWQNVETTAKYEHIQKKTCVNSLNMF